MKRPGRTAALLTLLLTVGGFQDPPDIATKVDQLVEQLKKLSPDASRDDFLKRPSMSQLMALGPAAFPSLKNHFLKCEDWAIKASVGYLVILMAQNSDLEVTSRRKDLLDDPNLFVQATMASLEDQFATGCIVQRPQLLPAAEAIVKRLQLSASVHWMAPADLKTLARNALLVIEAGKPLKEPPEWRNPGTWRMEGGAERLRSAGLRALTPGARMAELTLHRIFESPVAHEALQLVMESAENDDGTDQPRLGMKLRLTSQAVWHQEETGDRGACPIREKYKRRLFWTCEKWAWRVTDRFAQHAVLRALDYVGLWKAYDLREQLSKDHSDAQVKELAGRDLAIHWNGMLDRGHTREREKEDDERLKKAQETR